jgi:hypothetical protein
MDMLLVKMFATALTSQVNTAPDALKTEFGGWRSEESGADGAG